MLRVAGQEKIGGTQHTGDGFADGGDKVLLFSSVKQQTGRIFGGGRTG
jgi:hypothetical protein